VGAWLLFPTASVGISAHANTVRPTQCQGLNVLPGIEVFDLHHISGRSACRVALAFWNWEKVDHHYDIGGCRGVGEPYLKVHTWEKWHLSVSGTSGFKMSRGDTSFVPAGQDWPLQCT
jgi:hypothetical protein